MTVWSLRQWDKTCSTIWPAISTHNYNFEMNQRLCSDFLFIYWNYDIIIHSILKHLSSNHNLILRVD